LADGNFVTLWTEENGQDGSGKGVYGRILASDLTEVIPEFLVNT